MELTAAELWSRIREATRGAVPEHSYLTWLASAQAASLSSDELTLEVPSPFHVEWIEDKFGPLLSASAERVLGRPLTVRVVCGAPRAPAPLPHLELPPRPGANVVPAATEPAAVPRPPSLNERYTFDRFVVGLNTQLAVAACRAVAERPARMYNPLFLYGGVGLGKTHLMHAIGHGLLATRPHARICYVSSEQFTNELVGCIQEGVMPGFRRKYRDMDLLLMDDVHFLEGKERTQEEFFHTFNALYDAQRQIILTSDRGPKDLPGLEDRLVSRFEWGLVVDVKAPDYETRIAILRKKAKDDGLALDNEILDYIAQHCTASVRQLEGAIIKLLAFSSLKRQEITLDLARGILRGVLEPGGERRPTLSPERIREVVAARWRVRPDALASKRRTKDVMVPRQVAMYLIKALLDTPLAQIGRLFGGRDHSTVIHSLRKVEEDMATDADFRREVEELRRQVAGSPPHA